MARTKKDQKKKRRREIQRQKRRRIRAANTDVSLEVEPAHEPHSIHFESPWSVDIPTSPRSEKTTENSPSVVPKDPELDVWWKRLRNCEARERIEMLRQKLSEPIREDQPDDYYLEAIFESESGCSSAEFIAFLDEVRFNHPNIYKTGLHWLMRSRVRHYLGSGEMEKVDEVVIQDAEMMTESDEPFYGTISMVRLAGRTEAAEALAAAGFRCMHAKALMPWAQGEICHWAMDKHVRACAAAGATPEAFEQMESQLTEMGAVDNEEIVEFRRNIVSRLARNQEVRWQANQLTGTTEKAGRNRCLLGYDFAGWLVGERSIPAISADELRILLLNSFAQDRLTMKDFLGGLPQKKVDRDLAVHHLGFMGLNRFRAPASLIAMHHFVDFLHEIGLLTESSRAKSERVITSLRSQLEKSLKDEMDFRFLDPLWNV